MLPIYDSSGAMFSPYLAMHWLSQCEYQGGGHTGLILESPYGTLESEGWLCVEKVRKFFWSLPFEEKWSVFDQKWGIW